MQIRTTYNIVFMIPLTVFILGLLAVSASTERAQQAYEERYRAGFEADAAVRVLVRDALAARLQGYLRTYVSAVSSAPSLSTDEALGRGFTALMQNFGADSSSTVLHFYVATLNPQGRVIIMQSYPREELLALRPSRATTTTSGPSRPTAPTLTADGASLTTPSTPRTTPTSTTLAK